MSSLMINSTPSARPKAGSMYSRRDSVSSTTEITSNTGSGSIVWFRDPAYDHNDSIFSSASHYINQLSLESSNGSTDTTIINNHAEHSSATSTTLCDTNASTLTLISTASDNLTTISPKPIPSAPITPTEILADLREQRKEQLATVAALTRRARTCRIRKHAFTVLNAIDARLANRLTPNNASWVAIGHLAAAEAQNAATRARNLELQIALQRSAIREEKDAANEKTQRKNKEKAFLKAEKEKERESWKRDYRYVYGETTSFEDGFPAGPRR